MTTSLGAKIKRHRQENGFSLDKLAAMTDSSKSYIWELENRDARKPSGEKLTRIAQALSVTTDYLLDDSIFLSTGQSMLLQCLAESIRPQSGH